ncbi:hypothetical protein Tco_0405381 [Tanacetum coccineum]
MSSPLPRLPPKPPLPVSPVTLLATWPSTKPQDSAYMTSENQANLHAGQQEANHNAGPREEEQVFLDELERLKRQEKEANEEAEALRKEIAAVRDTESLDTCRSCPFGKKAIGTKWVYRTKKDEEELLVETKQLVSTTFVEQFWTSAKSKIINNVRHITAKVAGKPVSISEASIRSDLLFDDANGIDSLPNQAIFDAIQLMGSKSTSWDQIPTNIATAVICLTSNQKYNFSKLIFDGLFIHGQPTPSPAHTSEVPFEPQTDSSPAHTSEVPIEPQTDPSPRPSPSTSTDHSLFYPESSGRNL